MLPAFHFLLEEEEEEEEILTIIATIALGVRTNNEERAERRRASRLYLTRPDLLPNPRGQTPWTALYGRQDERAFITTMGLDPPAFAYLLQEFQTIWDSSTIQRTDVNTHGLPRLGRRSLDAAGGLGVALHYLNSTMMEKSLSQIFAIIPSTVNRYINFALHVLRETLRHIPEGSVQYPDNLEEFEELAGCVHAKHNLLRGVFGSLDGLKIPIGAADDPAIENQNYNGWLHKHFISSVLMFSPKGLVIAATLNAPGSWHDSRVANPIYAKLLNDTPEGFSVVADTAFPRGPISISGRIKAPMKTGQVIQGTQEEIQDQLLMNRQILAYRQTAEWGMRTLQGSFARLKVPMDANDSSKRGCVFEVVVRLHNFRTLLVGHNQIATTYSNVWREERDDRRLWDDFDNLLFGEMRRFDRVSRFHLIAVDM